MTRRRLTRQDDELASELHTSDKRNPPTGEWGGERRAVAAAAGRAAAPPQLVLEELLLDLMTGAS